MKHCTQCEASFEVIDEDRKFYDKVSPIFNGVKYLIPEPKRCTACRYQNRLSLRNERKLYKRKCDAIGKEIVSIFSPDKKFPPVYSQSYWWSDDWDAKSYGQNFDFNTPFFEQFQELYNNVPQLTLNNNKSENSEFTNQCEFNKNGYLLTCCSKCEDCYYSMWAQSCKNCCDCLYVSKSERCYELVNGEVCYECTHSENLNNCSNCHFSYNLTGCSHCIGCSNLSHKEYYIFNEPYSPEEYKKKVESLNLNTYSGRKKVRQKAKELTLEKPKKYYHGSKTEESCGDYIYEVKNGSDVFNCRYGENIRHCQDAWKARNCQDLTETFENDFCYSVEGSAYNTNGLFSMKIKETSNILYSAHCFYSNDLFGCVGMKNARYCILNKQYTKEEYEALVPKIIEHMKKSGEWGSYFPAELSHFGYNESVANEYFPLTKSDALEKGWKWSNYQSPAPESSKIIPAAKLPETIDQVPDDVMNWAIECENTGKLFKITPQELKSYRDMDLPLPHLHPDERHKQRMQARNPRQLWARKCDNCEKEIQTTYSPDRPEKVYCEKCYLKEVY